MPNSCILRTKKTTINIRGDSAFRAGEKTLHPELGSALSSPSQGLHHVLSVATDKSQELYFIPVNNVKPFVAGCHGPVCFILQQRPPPTPLQTLIPSWERVFKATWIQSLGTVPPRQAQAGLAATGPSTAMSIPATLPEPLR